MTDSPSQTYKRVSSDKQSTYLRRNAEFHSSPFSHEDSEVRNSYQMIQPQLQERKIFGFEIFVDNEILADLGTTDQWFESMIKANGVEHIKFNPDLTIPDLNGRNIQIFDTEMEKKYQCAKTMLNDIYQVFRKIKKEPFAIIIFVPEGMVSLLIGTKGHQINKIMKQSHTTIVVNQPINRMTYRTAKIQGYHSDIAKACRIIYEILQEKSSIAYSIEKQPSQLDYTKSKKKKKALLRKVEQETKCSIRFQTDKDNRLLKKDESICILNGKLEDVQAMLVMIINIAHDFLSDEKRNIDYTLKMLIPANYVTKLIGQKGYMIRDIIERSGGSQIKILSDKQSERDTKECIISINGTRQNKIDASCLILEQIQCFKNGGPILQSGKSINENLAQQFKNSLPLIHVRDQEGDMKPETDSSNPNNPPANQEIISTFSPGMKALNVISALKPKEEMDGNSEEEGLIDAEDEEKELKEQKEKEKKIAEKQNISSSIKIVQKSNEKESNSPSYSKSRSRQKRPHKGTRKRSSSSSIEFKHEREFVEVRLVVPKKLSQDHKQLKYVENLCKSEITVTDQVQGTGDSIISIKGSLKENCYCIKLLQKRLARMKGSTASSGR